MSTTEPTTEVMTPKQITKEARRRVNEAVEELGQLHEIESGARWITPVVDPFLGLALMKAEEALLWITRSGTSYDETEIAVLDELARYLWSVAGQIGAAVDEIPIYTDEEQEVNQ